MTDQRGSTYIPRPAGFPSCSVCPLWKRDDPSTCFDCVAASVGIRMVVPRESCEICSQATLDGQCRNVLCRSDRVISKIHAIARMTGPLGTRIKRYKYGEQRERAWGRVFGRLVYTWLERNMLFDPPNIVVANPTYVGPLGRHDFHHTELVLEHAASYDALGTFSIDDGNPMSALTARHATQQSAGGGWYDKRTAAIEHANAIDIFALSDIRGKRVLVYDDVCTTGLQLDAIARVLLDAGADQVEGLVLARQEWNY